MTAHTPQWYHHIPVGSQHSAGGFVTTSADRRDIDAKLICHVHFSTKYGKLIAAAPELLEALEDLASLAEAAMREVGEYDIEAELADARAAIAKATGGAA